MPVRELHMQSVPIFVDLWVLCWCQIVLAWGGAFAHTMLVAAAAVDLDADGSQFFAEAVRPQGVLGQVVTLLLHL